MDTAALIVVCAALLLLACAVGLRVFDVAWSRRLVLRRKVLVSLKTGRAFQGVLWQRRGGLVVLKSATLYEPGAEATTVDGEVLIEAAEVDYIQVAG